VTIEIPGEDYYTERIVPFNESAKGRSEIEEVIALLLQAGVQGRVLDAGCGPGLNVGRMREAEPSWKVVGADYSPAGVRIAARRAGGAFLNADAHHLCFPDEIFGGVIMTHAIGHVADPARVLGELHRVLRSGGALVLTTPNRLYVEVYRVFNERNLIPYRRDTTVLRYYDAAELEASLEAAGFAVKSIRIFGSHPRIERRLLDMNLLPPDMRPDDDARRERIIALALKARGLRAVL
jgi:ubiquinone/menaquinone biosynthesis C-methylase UbiE